MCTAPAPDDDIGLCDRHAQAFFEHMTQLLPGLLRMWISYRKYKIREGTAT